MFCCENERFFRILKCENFLNLVGAVVANVWICEQKISVDLLSVVLNRIAFAILESFPKQYYNTGCQWYKTFWPNHNKRQFCVYTFSNTHQSPIFIAIVRIWCGFNPAAADDDVSIDIDIHSNLKPNNNTNQIPKSTATTDLISASMKLASQRFEFRQYSQA